MSNINTINSSIDDILKNFITNVPPVPDQYSESLVLEMIENTESESKKRINRNTLFFAIKCMNMKIVSSIFNNLSDCKKSKISLSYILEIMPKPLLQSDIDYYYWLELLKYMIDQNIKPQNEQTYYNTFSLAIKTSDLIIIKRILETNPVPNNKTLTFQKYDCEPVTLTHAVNTKNIDIINVALQRGATACIIYNQNSHILNTLTAAVKTLDYDIIRRIIINGGKVNHLYEDSNYCVNIQLFYVFIEEYVNIKIFRMNNNHNKDTINKIINIIMCSGAKINEKIFRYITIKCEIFSNLEYTNAETILNNFVKSKLESCYKLLNNIDKSNPIQIKLIHELKETMKDIIDPLENRKEIINEIEPTIENIPICLIDIIYQYLHQSLINMIDWDKYR